jgi:hypothetical protein
MKAVRLHEYGQRSAVEEVDEPAITELLDVIVRIDGVEPKDVADHADAGLTA